MRAAHCRASARGRIRPQQPRPRRAFLVALSAIMCGIAGSTTADRDLLTAMMSDLGHRGPDGNGLWQDATSATGLVHTRLAIIDLSPGGAQPFHSEDGRFALTYNGEIFNYRALRGELEAAGERFRTESDTEVLLRLLQREGTASLARVV